MAHIFQPDAKGGVDKFYNLDHWHTFKYTPASGGNPSTMAMSRDGAAGGYQVTLVGQDAEELREHLRRLHMTSVSAS